MRKLPDSEKYNRFIQDLEILNIHFPEVFWKLHQIPRPKTRIQNEFEFDISEIKISPEKDKVVIRSFLHVRGRKDSKKRKELLYEMRLTQDLFLQVNAEHFSEDLLEFYIRKNAVISIVSVFRERVREVSFLMGIRPIILPAIKMGIAREEEKKGSHKEERKESSESL